MRKSTTGTTSKHGEAWPQTAEYRVWASMHTRCRNPKSRGYRLYGARGITVCRRWSRYENFLQDMGRRPSPQHQLERSNNNKGYTPGNCVWATRSEQARNKRTTRYLTWRGVTLSMAAWAERTGINLKVISERLISGWSIERALSSPLMLGRPLRCKNGHLLETHSRWEGKSRRCVLCKRMYDQQRRSPRSSAR